MIAGSALTVIVAEQLCVKREMSEGLVVQPIRNYDESEEMEMGNLSRRE
jgi:protein SYS1